ncbi:tetratricopeptide repeat protein [Labrenzia sp. PHM005]|uniref:tetratricopeptide repeat protein n=1 Tax=Labrenzia sp. PHM005 TaxID=2590016 RepID=UPI00113FCB43|nr:tetratricopeptide repeat protein [Labrenzia sp. PHM005]QDG77611.1 tetratricopeptide repeat protein [Labrenzia sp. PHM005]
MDDQTNTKNVCISKDQVLDALSRILRSEEFRDADRLSDFLQYVVEQTLAGKSASIKATTIALDVFDRELDKDTGSDSIVRVTAARLRRALGHYYSEDGTEDPVQIEWKTGSYVPQFVLRVSPKPPAVQTGSRSAGDKTKRHPVTFLAVAAFAVIMAVIGYSFTTSETPASKVAPENKPFIAVLPLKTAENDDQSQAIAERYLEAVVTSLARLPDVSVMAARSAISAAKTNTPLEVLNQNHGISHVLRGSLNSQADSVRMNVQLVDTITGTILFAERFGGTTANLFELEDKIANRLATALSITTDKDIVQRVYLPYSNNSDAINLVREAIVRINPPNEKSRVEASKDLFQRALKLDPKFAGGFAGLSQAHSYMVLFDHSKDPMHDLGKAIEFAEMAVELDPAFGNGHAMLGLAHSLSGNTDQAMRNVRRAVVLEPGDPLSYQWLGGVLIFSGRSQEAVDALREAIRLDPLEPGTPYLNILGMAYFNLEQYDDAIEVFEQNILDGGPDAPNMEAYRAATYSALGREAEARRVLARLNVRAGEITPERWIRSWTPSSEHAERAIQSLYDLGMKKSHSISSD